MKVQKKAGSTKGK